MVLEQACKDLFLFYTDVVNVYDGLLKLGQSYKSQFHINYFIDNVEFYRKATGWTGIKRLIHFPKILKDKAFMRNKLEAHTKNNRNLDVFVKLNYAGFNFVDT